MAFKDFGALIVIASALAWLTVSGFADKAVDIKVDDSIYLGQSREEVYQKLEKRGFQRVMLAAEDLYQSKKLSHDLRLKYNDAGRLAEARGDFQLIKVGDLALTADANQAEVRQLLGEPTKVTYAAHGIQNLYYAPLRLHIVFVRAKHARFALGGKD